MLNTLPETNGEFTPENRPSQKEMIVFQPSIFRCELLVSGSVFIDSFIVVTRMFDDSSHIQLIFINMYSIKS